MIRPPMKLKGVSIEPLILPSVKVESIPRNVSTGNIPPPMREGEGVKAVISSASLLASTRETLPSVKVEASCAAESRKADTVRYQGVKSEGIPSNMKVRMIRPPMRGRGGLKTRGPSGPLVRGMRSQIQMGHGAVRMQGQRPEGMGIQAHRPRVTGMQGHRPEGIHIGIQAHRPRGTGIQAHRPRGTGMQGNRTGGIRIGMQAHRPAVIGTQGNRPRGIGMLAHRPGATGMQAHGPRVTGTQAHRPRITGTQAYGPRITRMPASRPRITRMQANMPGVTGRQANRLGVPRQPLFGGLRPRMTTNSGARGEAHPKTVSFPRAPKYPIASVRLGDAGAPPPEYLKPTTASHPKEINVPTRPMGAQFEYPQWQPVDPTNLPRAPLPKVIKVEPIDISDEESSPSVKEESLFPAPKEFPSPATEETPSPATEKSPSPAPEESSSAMLDQFENLKSFGISVTRNTTSNKSKRLDISNGISLTPVKDK